MTEKEYKDPELENEGVHVVDDIHENIIVYQVIVMYIFVVIAASSLGILSPEYFSFKTPMVILGVSVSSNIVVVAVTFFLMYDRVVANFSDELRLRSCYIHEGVEESLSSKLVMKSVNVVVSQMRYVVLLVFVKSQFSLALVIIVFDLIAHATVKYPTVALNGKKWRHEGHDVAVVACMLEVVEIPMVLLVFQFCGLYNTSFFHIGPPFALFGEKIVSTAVYTLIVLVAFADAAIATTIKNSIDSWCSGYLQNTSKSKKDIHLTIWETRYVSVVRFIVSWLRIAFVYSFFTTQFFFVFVYIVGELLPSLLYIYRQHVSTESAVEFRRRMLILASVQLIETIYLVIVIVMPNWLGTTYFRWPKSIAIFDVLVTNGRVIVVLLVYSAFDRISATLYSHIVVPDIENWLYSQGHHLGYGVAKTMMIIMVSRFNMWFRYILLIQFVLASIYFIAVSAIVDIPLTIIITERYIRHKEIHHIDCRNQQAMFAFSKTFRKNPT